jgi:hypothetical protein
MGNSMKFIRFCAAAIPALLLSACADVKPKPMDPSSGLFPTMTILDKDAVRLSKPFDPKFKHLVYVKVPDEKPKEFSQFYVTELRNSKLFDQVANKSDLEAIVIQRNLTDRVPNVSDMVGLHRLAEEIGPFLVVEPYFQFRGGYSYTGQLTAIDPASGQTVLLLQQNAFNWAGLDSPLVYPLLNGFVQWARGGSIQTKAGAVTPPGQTAAN